MKSPDNKPQLPFKKDFKAVDINKEKPIRVFWEGKFRVLKSEPNKIFRRISKYNKNSSENKKLPKEALDRMVNETLTLKNIFQSLPAHGFNIPNIDFFISEDLDGSSSVFAMVDKIDGVNFNDMLSSSDLVESFKAKKMLQDLVFQWIKYLETCSNNQQDYLIDIYKPSDYVYGKKPGDSEDNLYLVDFDDWHFSIGEMDLEDKKNYYTQQLIYRLKFIIKMLVFLEKDLNIKFEKARNYLKKISETSIEAQELIGFMERAEREISSVGINKF